MTYSAQAHEHADLLSALLAPTFARHQNHSFGGRAEPIVARAGSHAVADAIVNMLMARVELQTAKQLVPAYTAQWSNHDYTANERATYDQACNDLLDALRSALD